MEDGRAESRPNETVDRRDADMVRFGPEIEPLHQRIDLERVDDLYVVGDVHGCIDELRALWTRIAPSPTDLVVFVGDLVRKGPDSRGVVEFITDRENAVSVRGNNEAKVLDGSVTPTWASAVEEQLANLPLAVSWEGGAVVHGGVHPNRPFVEHDPTDLLEMRAIPPGNGYGGPFWFDLYSGRPRIFFGHTVLEDPYLGEAAIGLDTGCVYGGRLTAYDVRRDEIHSVPARKTYRERAHAKIIES